MNLMQLFLAVPAAFLILAIAWQSPVRPWT